MIGNRFAIGWFLLFSSGVSSASETVLYERFEGKPAGAVKGGVEIVTQVVGYGGIGASNKSSAKFDGRAETAVVYGPEALVEGPDFTVEAFVRPVGNLDYAVIAAQGDEPDNQRAWALVLTAGNGLRFDVMPDGSFISENALKTPNRALREDAWSHVAAVSDKEVSRIYVNGRLVAEKKRRVPGLFNGRRFPIRIGNIDHYSGQPRPFSGWIDEVRVTRRALSPDEFLKTREPMPEYKGPIPEKFDLPFTAKSHEEAAAWQKQARAALFKLVSARTRQESLESRPLDFKIVASEDRGSYTLHHAWFRGNNGRRYPCLWTVPKGEGPFPAVLCLHGHGGSAEDVFSGSTLYRGFAERLARGGYCCLAPSFPHQTFAAEMLWDLIRCVDILAGEKVVDPQRIGVMGLSMGGEWTMWIAACDERLRVAVVSGWMCTTEGCFAVFNCPCWELPGFVELMDVCEVHLLIAPRPVLFESAESDPCFLLKYTKQGYERIRAGYRVFGAEDACGQDVFPGGHMVSGAKAFPLLDKVLGGKATGAAK